MKITLDLSEERLAKFGITNDTPPEMANTIISKAIDEQIPYRFVLECIQDVALDDYENLWTAGETYKVEYYCDKILADSDSNDFQGTFMDEEDFLNNFIVKEVSPDTAKVMINEGYTDMFEHFLPENERPDFKEFYIIPLEEVDYGDGIELTEGKEYKMEHSPLSKAFTVYTDSGVRFLDSLDFDFKVTAASPEVAKYMIENIPPLAKEFKEMAKVDLIEKE